MKLSIELQWKPQGGMQARIGNHYASDAENLWNICQVLLSQPGETIESFLKRGGTIKKIIPQRERIFDQRVEAKASLPKDPSTALKELGLL